MDPAGTASARSAPSMPGRLLRSLANLGAAFTVLAYGLLGFGIILLGGPGLILLAISGSWRSLLVPALGLGFASVLIVGALLLAVLYVSRPLQRGEFDRARLPTVLLTVGNLGVAVTGGLLSFDLLAFLGLLGALIYLPVLLLLTGPGRPTTARA